MGIEPLKIKQNSFSNKRLEKAYDKMLLLIKALEKKEIPEEIAQLINRDISAINSFSGTERGLTKLLKKTHSKLLKFIEEHLKYVPKNHYRNLGMVMGILFGSTLSAIFQNYGFGVSFGMLIGIVVGIHFDKKAEETGRQLEFVFGESL